MSLLDKASLIVTPNAYEESKLYSVIPNTTLGDMDVVRATTATRVNEQGLIEVVPRNLFTYSEQFENTAWTKVSSTITANSTTAPNGTLTADKLIEAATSSEHWAFQSTTNTISSATISCYMKKGERNWGFIRTRTTFNDFFAWFNLDNGTVGTVQSGITASITDVGNGWYRCVVISPNPTTGANPSVIGVSNADNVISYLGDGTSGIFIWGAQLDQGSTATEYFPTTTRLNIPRIDYTNGSCPSLLVEPQRTNLLIRSNAFVGVGWTISGTATITSNFAISPDGTQNAAKLTAATQGTSGIYQIIVGTASVNYSRSIYMKSVSGNTETIRITDPWGTGSDGILVTINGQWNRYTLTSPLALGVNGGIWINNIPTAGIYIYGSQLELGSYATSYIPTVASTVTRNADVISKTGISSLIGQTEGTIYAEIKVNKLIGTASRYIFHISDGTANNRIYIAFSGASSNVLRGRIFNGGTLQCSIDTSTITTTGTYKLALAYKNNDIVFYVNGVQIGIDTSATIPTCSKVDIGHNYAGASQLGDGITNTNIFKTRLTNTELQSLTTL